MLALVAIASDVLQLLPRQIALARNKFAQFKSISGGPCGSPGCKRFGSGGSGIGGPVKMFLKSAIRVSIAELNSVDHKKRGAEPECSALGI